MPIFVVFLRGINVGGHIVKKETLQEAFGALGFQNVSTFKQSGNVIFESNTTDLEELKGKIEEKLRSTLSYDVAVFIRTIPQLKGIIDLDPFKGQDKAGTSFLVTLLANPPPAAFRSQLPLTIPKSTAQIISSKGREVFSLTHGGGEGALPNPFVESKLKVKATTRNMNIIGEISEKFG
ncbi:MAG: DUF1697 domain-containing protein [Candidatus Bathyarchaeia archaeon]|jgi:uncharacterized protein (DUF1697 family)